MILRALTVVATVVLLAGATSGSCSGEDPAAISKTTAFTALEVNGEAVGVPMEVLTRVEAQELAPGEDVAGAERPLSVDSVKIRFKGELSPAFHAWVSDALRTGAPAQLALVFLDADKRETGRITLPQAKLLSLGREAPSGGVDDGAFSLQAQDYNSSRSNKSGAEPFALPPVPGTEGDPTPTPEVALAGMDPDLSAAVTVDGFEARRCDGDTVCGSTTHFLIASDHAKDVHAWFQKQAEAGLHPQLTLTYRTQQGRVAAKLSLELAPETFHSDVKGENPLYESSSAEGVNPLFE